MLQEVESRKKALKSDLKKAKDSTKALQDEVEHLNQEFALFKVNAAMAKEALKIDLNLLEVEIHKTHEEKALYQVKFILKDTDLFPL